MGQLIVRNLDDGIVEALKARAKANGRSAEAEHRRILEDALDLAARQKRGDRLREELAELRKQIGGEEDWESASIIREMRDGRG